jgi:hypothetical protein
LLGLDRAKTNDRVMRRNGWLASRPFEARRFGFGPPEAESKKPAGGNIRHLLWYIGDSERFNTACSSATGRRVSGPVAMCCDEKGWSPTASRFRGQRKGEKEIGLGISAVIGIETEVRVAEKYEAPALLLLFVLSGQPLRGIPSSGDGEYHHCRRCYLLLS